MSDNEALKVKIAPEYSKEEFLRAAWISLINDDAPIEIFEENFKEVTENEHQVLIDSISVDVSYQVSVGYDRQEPYIGYETYYEDEPYIANEKYYDRDSGTYKTRQVTKYKKVQRQRQVTKYKTVTDWSALNGTHHASSIATAENIPGQYLDKELFSSSFSTKKSESSIILDDEEGEELTVNEAAHESVMQSHRSAIYSSVYSSLPGDHNRDLDYKITDITSSTTAIYKTEEYEAPIHFKGKVYTKKAFPFGSMKIGGDKIQNSVSLENVTQKMKDDMTVKINKRREAVSENVFETTKIVSIINFALLLISVIVSLFVRRTPVVIIAFAVAVAFFIFNFVFVKNETKKETERAEKYIKDEIASTSYEIENYASNYKLRQSEALNKKLKSLGFRPADADELKAFNSSITDNFRY